MLNRQRGNVLVGVIIGVVLGLAAALAVAVYVTKVPIPFVSKTPGRTAEQDAAESRKNKDWDPNAPLHGKNPAKPLPPVAAPAASAPVAERPGPAASAPPAARSSAGDPLGDLAASRSASPAADPFIYFVQVGAFRAPEDAEAQRAKLSLMGVEARITEREQSGRQVFRVRVGPFDRKDDADLSKEKLEAVGLETALVRVQR
ncbi:SPOR domain-containing protein [Ramlibacter sp. Leaf400]|uniref:SPOR domain-containing protein n=1 Tax=Ramlibacter sp. Leaf400 TaxID=1736365 RepID=UPI0006F7BC4D|nr:SPOR domain-containing protein [Ramlibacter sp. Leaf400]KQT12507.1 sporulation protein [Ramlibacter sp. Leaf400]